MLYYLFVLSFMLDIEYCLIVLCQALLCCQQLAHLSLRPKLLIMNGKCGRPNHAITSILSLQREQLTELAIEICSFLDGSDHFAHAHRVTGGCTWAREES